MTYVASATDDVSAELAAQSESSSVGQDRPDILGRLGLHTSPADANAAGGGDGSDRRRRLRIPANNSVKLFDPVSERYFAGHTCDVSETGLCLTLPARLPVRSGGTARLYVAGDSAGRGALVERTQMHDVRFVWVRRDDRAGTATCGVELLTNTAGARGAWGAEPRHPALRAA